MTPRQLTDAEKETCRKCSQLNGQAMLDCMGDLFPKPAKEWDVSMPSRGIGDTIAKITTFTGIKAVVDAVATATGTDCGCAKRQEAMNKAVPFTQ